ncbi:MAG: hypothetical protein QOJ18_1450, partial [Microbacteriaceae bacterium]|nr:hypothetical protein [Microbacteriaceae bacterium]
SACLLMVCRMVARREPLMAASTAAFWRNIDA